MSRTKNHIMTLEEIDPYFLESNQGPTQGDYDEDRYLELLNENESMRDDIRPRKIEQEIEEPPF